jgi:hypothetical protein
MSKYDSFSIEQMFGIKSWIERVGYDESCQLCKNNYSLMVRE